MVQPATFRNWALALPGATEAPHFNRPSFRVRKKIFATLWAEERRAMLQLPPVVQAVYCAADPSAFSPVPGTWGVRGATFVDLRRVGRTLFREALETAHRAAAQKPTGSGPLH